MAMRSWLWRLIKRFLFSIDAETAHRLTVVGIRLGIRFGGAPLRIASGASPQLPAPGTSPELCRYRGRKTRDDLRIFVKARGKSDS